MRMAQEAIDTFMSITGASEEVAVQRLEEHGGDLNRAIDAHFNEGDVMSTRPTYVPQPEQDFMVIDDPVAAEPTRFSLPTLASGRNLDPLSLLDPSFGQRFFDIRDRANDADRMPFVSHPREVREIPIEVKDGNNQPNQSGPSRPKIEEVTGSSFPYEPEIRGKVVIENDDDEDDPAPNGVNLGQTEVKNSFIDRHLGSSAPQLNVISDDNNDIEEEMLRAAIEASKREAEIGYPEQHFGDTENSSGSLIGPRPNHPDDAEMAHAVSLSLKTAEQERALREGKVVDGTAEMASSSAVVEEFGRVPTANGRQEFGLSDKENSIQHKWDTGSSFMQEDAEDEDAEPLVRNRSKRFASGSEEPSRGVGSAAEYVSSSPETQHVVGTPPQRNPDTFQSDEWGGISSEEQEEAYMLEAALFGVSPEDAAYRFGYHQPAAFPRPVQQPPSPTLTAQRLLREQQDDEYFASLQADREKELKAKEEAEAALEQEKQKAEEARRKLLEEEEFERQLAAKEASLPQEPALEDENAVTLLIRMPDGSRRGRRFRKSDKIQALFDFVDVARVVKPGTYRLVRPYPRRAYSDGESELSLGDLGLSSKQEALFLELI